MSEGTGERAPQHVEDCPSCGAPHARFDRTHMCRPRCDVCGLPSHIGREPCAIAQQRVINDLRAENASLLGRIGRAFDDLDSGKHYDAMATLEAALSGSSSSSEGGA